MLSSIRKKHFLIAIILGVTIWLLAKNKDTKSTEGKKHSKVIAITQIVEHPGLNIELAGMRSVLAAEGYTDIILQNAHGNSVTAVQIAQKLVAAHPDVIIALSTPSAQSVLAAIGTNKIPLVFSAVTDPVAARLIKDISIPESYVTGVCDNLSGEAQLKFVLTLIPSLKRLGIIYNPGEANSAAIFQQLLQAASSLGIQLIPATPHRSSEVAAAAQSLVGRSEAIFVPNDNTASAALESIVRVGHIHKIPVLSGDPATMPKGIAAAVGYDRHRLGELAGKMAIRILLEGPNAIPVATDHSVQISLNKEAAHAMDLTLPKDLPSNIKIWRQ